MMGGCVGPEVSSSWIPGSVRQVLRTESSLGEPDICGLVLNGDGDVTCTPIVLLAAQPSRLVIVGRKHESRASWVEEFLQA